MGQAVFPSPLAIAAFLAIGGFSMFAHSTSVRRLRRKFVDVDAGERKRLVWKWVIANIAGGFLYMIALGVVAEISYRGPSRMWNESSTTALVLTVIALVAWTINVLMSAKWGYALFNDQDKLRWV